MIYSIIRMVVIVGVLQNVLSQEVLPEDVEIVTGKYSPGSKLSGPFNRGYAEDRYAILQPQLNVPSWRASAILVGDNPEGGPSGLITFTQFAFPDSVMVTMNATGLPPGKHAVHIHAFGDLKEGCKSTGPHMRNILIGNIEVKEDGLLELSFHSPYLQLFGPNKGIIGRSIVIHEKPIEYNRFPDIRGYPITPTLNMSPFQAEEMGVGNIIACGIITITNNLV